MARRTVWIVVLLAALFLLVGFVVARLRLFPGFTLDLYFKQAAFVGGVASIFGLLGLALPRITSEDLRQLNLESLRRVADLAEEMQSAEKELSKKSAALDELETKK